MILRLVISIGIGLLAYAAYQIYTMWQRHRADTVDSTASHPGGEQAHIVYFRSDTCASCATQSRLFEQSEELRDRVTKVDVDREPEKARQYGVMTVPTLILIDAQGKAQNIHYGVVHPRKLLQQLIALA